MAYIVELAKALKHEDPEKRVRILKALMELKDPRATPSLLEALDDCCLEVRRAAMRALSWIGDERSRYAFIEALREGDFSLRFWAAIGLQKVGDVSAVEALIDALKDPDEGVRWQAVIALAEIGDRRAVDPLIEALDDEESYVHEAARDALRDSFRLDYDPVAKKTTVIPKEEPVEFESLPIEEQRKSKRQLRVVYKKIKVMDQISSPVRGDKLYDSLYEVEGINRRHVAQSIGTLLENGSIITLKRGYYAIAVLVSGIGTNTKPL